MEVAHNVVDRAVQTYGAAGVSDDTVLARLFAITRALQIADGPNEVHLRTIARLEVEAGDVMSTPESRRQGRPGHRRDPRPRLRHRTRTRGRGRHRRRVQPQAGGLRADAVARLGDAGPAQRHAAALHVGHWDSIEPAVDDIIAVSAASTSWSTTPASRRSPTTCCRCRKALWDKTIEVNLKGPFRLMAVAGDRMAAAGGGSIINISSIGAVRPSPPRRCTPRRRTGSTR